MIVRSQKFVFYKEKFYLKKNGKFKCLLHTVEIK